MVTLQVTSDIPIQFQALGAAKANVGLNTLSHTLRVSSCVICSCGYHIVSSVSFTSVYFDALLYISGFQLGANYAGVMFVS
jgi:hypothetical protein